MGCCSRKGLPLNDTSLSVRAVELGVHLLSHQFLVRMRGKTAFAPLCEDSVFLKGSE